MSNGKYAKRKGVATKAMVMILAVMLIVGISVGGTLAWLTAKTDDVVNTFTTSDINITLVETKGGNNREFKMVPGWTIEKDPKVTVATGSEKCYLFVKLEKSSNFDSFMTYQIAAGWTQLKDANDNDVTGVFYRVVDTTGMGAPYSVLKDDQVSVKNTVTKEMMNGLTTDTTTSYPTLTVTAYASQYMKSNTKNFTPAEAWTNVNPASTT